MQDAKRRIPHFSYVEEIDVTDLEALRAHLNQKWGGQRGKLTLLPFLVRAMVVALTRNGKMCIRDSIDPVFLQQRGDAAGEAVDDGVLPFHGAGDVDARRLYLDAQRRPAGIVAGLSLIHIFRLSAITRSSLRQRWA